MAADARNVQCILDKTGPLKERNTIPLISRYDEDYYAFSVVRSVEVSPRFTPALGGVG